MLALYTSPPLSKKFTAISAPIRGLQLFTKRQTSGKKKFSFGLRRIDGKRPRQGSPPQQSVGQPSTLTHRHHPLRSDRVCTFCFQSIVWQSAVRKVSRIVRSRSTVMEKYNILFYLPYCSLRQHSHIDSLRAVTARQGDYEHDESTCFKVPSVYDCLSDTNLS